MSRKNIMLCVPFEEKRLLKWKPPYIVQPKLDGERCRAVFDGDKWTLFSSENNPIISVPHIIEDLTNSYGEKIPIELDGELYIHRLSFEEIHSRVSRTKNLHPDFSDIKYYIFDIVSSDYQAERLTLLKDNWKTQNSLKVVFFHLANSLEEILNIYEEILDAGFEGIIVRHFFAPYLRKRSTYIMKFKPKKSDYYKIIGFNEEISKDGYPKGRLGSFICISDEGTKFSVGSGLTDKDREKYWRERESFIGEICHVQYQHITPGKGVPRFPIFVDILDLNKEIK